MYNLTPWIDVPPNSALYLEMKVVMKSLRS